MHVLIVGYGKIGRVKATLWFAMGAKIYVYEQNRALHSKILEDGYSLFASNDQKFDIIDISTPAGMHYKALTWALDAVPDSDIYIIEKPLASTWEELKSFKLLLSEDPDLSRKIVINESYYQSVLLNRVAKDIKSRKANIQSINIELSKNRLNDIVAGRFFDNDLGSVGLEVPHMIAVLDKFGIYLPEDCKPSLIVDKHRYANQAFILRKNNGTPRVVLESYIGDFRYEGTSVTTNNAITRKAFITTDILDYQIEFDPLIDNKRFHGKLTIIEKGVVLSKELVLDNHLSAQLHLIQSGKPLHKTSVGVVQGLKATETLLQLRDSCVVTEFEQVAMDAPTLSDIDSEIKWH